jgi:hypothetical protein
MIHLNVTKSRDRVRVTTIDDQYRVSWILWGPVDLQ